MLGASARVAAGFPNLPDVDPLPGLELLDRRLIRVVIERAVADHPDLANAGLGDRGEPVAERLIGGETNMGISV